MSAAAMAWAWKKMAGLDLPAASKLVLLRLADRADPEGKCWPGHERTARDLNLSKSSVKSAIRLLASRGLLTIESRTGPTGTDAANLYHLALLVDGEGSNSDPSRQKAGGRGQILPPGGVKTLAMEGAGFDPEPRAEPQKQQQHAASKQFTIRNGVECWTAEDQTTAAALVKQHGVDAVASVASALSSLGIGPVPGRVAQELQRRAAAALEAKARTGAEERSARLDAESRRRAELEMAELLALKANQTSQERDP